MMRNTKQALYTLQESIEKKKKRKNTTEVYALFRTSLSKYDSFVKSYVAFFFLFFLNLLPRSVKYFNGFINKIENNVLNSSIDTCKYTHYYRLLLQSPCN